LPRQHVDVSVATIAGPERVFALVGEGAAWPRWSSAVTSFALERPGGTEPEGSGAVRVFRVRRIVVRVEVVELTPGVRYSYRLLSGMPMRDYLGIATFRPGRIRWRLSFAPTIPGTGWCLRLLMRRFVTVLVRDLARCAEQQAV
jgi:hypothetical protein